MNREPWPVFSVEIPFTPHRSLNPNHRAHPFDRGTGGMNAVEARQLLRRAARLATRSRMVSTRWQPPATGRLGLELFVYWERGRIPSGRQMPDEDNLIASCKALIDGLADALGIDDKRFKFRGIEQDHDPNGAGCVVARITPEAQ